MKKKLDARDVLAMLGFILLVTGVALIHYPAALIVAGLILLWAVGG